MAACEGYSRCAVCDRDKKPLGRTAPMEMGPYLCADDCPGYHQPPLADCRWPGEDACGPGCGRGR